ncbi:hypothetical protein [Xanthobacter tagetidis]|uniref:Uncharacterized protein n=1 Tax=Xanthobacter tagetidis TaxID=60216 RepID=A0A3L6ZWC2_9HYPH|nr:hypothetical protein [Xanthobacter tagetidis]MBB6310160.1 NADH-quinone oxidoreductase subunit E [Xanthobacter tagetidis]RLP72197.1 hypothetical protein D9R14_21940 [Xanthobacter tagetidis]
MTAFAIETLLLLALVFAIGFAIGLYLRARRTRAAAERGEAALAVPPAALLATEADRGATPAPEAKAPPDDVAPVPSASAEPPAGPLPAVQGELLLGASAPLPAPLAKPAPKPQAKPAIRGDAEADHPGQRPPALEAPEAGSDDLKLIKGIGPQNEARLHALGIHRLSQIAEWSADEALWVGSYLAFPGRIEREDWIGQAKALIAGTKPEDLRLPPRRPG